MKRIAMALSLSAAVSVGVIVTGMGQAAAICAAPAITVSPTQGAPGSVTVVSGHYFISTCNDTVVNGVPPAPNAPQTGIAIVFNQDGQRTPLSTIDATGSSGTFTVTVVVPVTAHAGSSQFEASRPEGPVSQAFTVVARSTTLPHTGSDTSRLMLGALAVLACGLVIVFALGRRAVRTP